MCHTLNHLGATRFRQPGCVSGMNFHHQPLSIDVHSKAIKKKHTSTYHRPLRIARAIQCQSDIGIAKLQRHCKRPMSVWDSETSLGPAVRKLGQVYGESWRTTGDHGNDGKLIELVYIKNHRTSSNSAVLRSTENPTEVRFGF